MGFCAPKKGSLGSALAQLRKVIYFTGAQRPAKKEQLKCLVSQLAICHTWIGAAASQLAFI